MIRTPPRTPARFGAILLPFRIRSRSQKRIMSGIGFASPINTSSNSSSDKEEHDDVRA
jgi:hypothetical protein